MRISRQREARDELHRHVCLASDRLFHIYPILQPLEAEAAVGTPTSDASPDDGQEGAYSSHVDQRTRTD